MYRVVVIGTSLGGLEALKALLRALPQSFPAPVAVVQHRLASGDRNGLAALLQRHTALRVQEPMDKEPLAAGMVYLAPADYHLMIEDDGFSLSTGDPVSYARPSVDVLFESAADAYGHQVIAVVLTGANRDGARGAAAIKDRGGVVLVQDPATAESPGMPEAVIASTPVDAVLPLESIPPLLERLCGSTPARTRK